MWIRKRPWTVCSSIIIRHRWPGAGHTPILPGHMAIARTFLHAKGFDWEHGEHH
ncbi:hypothetical protein HMPREF9413_0924 [Paenibacillus sp. HGF7]|nr:hypothetical protein HMPREF9413_0924 [Paenibacillus sp. HGF7]